MTSGVSGVFLFLLPQLILLVWALMLSEQSWIRRTLSSITIGALAFAILSVEVLTLDLELHLGWFVVLSLAWAALPVLLLPKMETNSPDFVEKLIIVQQLCLRLFVLLFISENAINVTNYELSETYGVGILSAAGATLFIGIFFLRRGGWALVVQTILSIFLIGISLNPLGASPRVVLIMVLLLAVAGFTGGRNPPFLIRRLNCGALGGGLFLALLSLTDTAFSKDKSLLGIWFVIFFVMGGLSWIQVLPEEGSVKQPEAPSRGFYALTALQILVQITFLCFIWPRSFSLFGVVP